MNIGIPSIPGFELPSPYEDKDTFNVVILLRAYTELDNKLRNHPNPLVARNATLEYVDGVTKSHPIVTKMKFFTSYREIFIDYPEKRAQRAAKVDWPHVTTQTVDIDVAEFESYLLMTSRDVHKKAEDFKTAYNKAEEQRIKYEAWIPKHTTAQINAIDEAIVSCADIKKLAKDPTIRITPDKYVHKKWTAPVFDTDTTEVFSISYSLDKSEGTFEVGFQKDSEYAPEFSIPFYIGGDGKYCRKELRATTDFLHTQEVQEFFFPKPSIGLKNGDGRDFVSSKVLWDAGGSS